MCVKDFHILTSFLMVLVELLIFANFLVKDAWSVQSKCQYGQKSLWFFILLLKVH